MLEVRVKKTHPHAELPSKGSEGAACYDVKTVESIRLVPGLVYKVKTGLVFELPPGFELEIRPRSGWAEKGLLLCNSPGTLDSDYRGELIILLRNLNREPLFLNGGDRIAQIKVNKSLPILFTETQSLSSTERDSGGFGSTGL